MGTISLAEAGKIAKRAKPTLIRAIQAGKLVGKLQAGRWLVDVDSLKALYPEQAKSRDEFGVFADDNQLEADPHLILSYIKKGLAWPDVIAEWIDNAFDVSAGNAKTVVIEVGRDYIAVVDDGIGVADLNRLAQLGSSGSYHHDGAIGTFGVGAKGWMCKGSRFWIRTIHAGSYHEHQFDLAPVIRSIKLRKPEWLRRYQGLGKFVGDVASGTTVQLSGFYSGTKPVILPSLFSALELKFWPAVRAGKKLLLRDARKPNDPEWTLEDIRPPGWSDAIEFSGSINGKTYKAKIGIITENIGKYRGLHFGFLWRAICTETQLSTRAVPSRVHGQIELGPEWRESLGNYKDKITEDREELLAEIEVRAKEVFDKAEEYTEQLVLEDIATRIKQLVQEKLRAGHGVKKPKPEPKPEPVDTPVLDEQGDGDKDRIRQPRPPKAGHDKPKGPTNEIGINYQFAPLGRDNAGMVEVSPDELSLTVKLNSDSPKLKAVSLQPKYPGLYIAIASILLAHCSAWDNDKIERIFGGMIGEAAGSGDKPKMLQNMLSWWAFMGDEERQTMQ